MRPTIPVSDRNAMASSIGEFLGRRHRDMVGEAAAAGARTSPAADRAREYVVMTDAECQLYHFTVEGSTIKDGTKIPAETGLGTVTSICWKADVIVRGCSEGNVNIWNMKTRQADMQTMFDELFLLSH